MVKVYFYYIFFGIVVFYFGPLKYPSENQMETFLFLAVYYGALSFGFLVGSKLFYTKPRYSIRSKEPVFLFLSSIILSMAAVLSMLSNVDGSLYQSIKEGIFDSGNAYYGNIEKEKVGSIYNQIYVFLFPLFFIIVCVGVQKFKELSFLNKSLLVAIILINAFSYIIKGTNFGVFMTIVPIVVSIFMKSQKISKAKLLTSVAVTSIFITYFLVAITSRLNFDYVPGSISGIEVDKEHFIFSFFPVKLAVAISVACSYISQGYYGLSLSFSYPFDSTFGFGSGYFIMSKSTMFGANEIELWLKTYQQKMAVYWDPRIQWHTGFVWLANDVSHYGVPVLMGFFGFLSSLVYKSAKEEGASVSVALFSVIVIILFFIPANNILMSNPFIFFSFFTLLIVWLCSRRYYLNV
ncbi:O-antigen polymerase [Pseudoalteromonas sp. OANN1]|uniref:O-antigen polymerase n=1 Tax=Pseudoalteromonas sp. OANN1 TaxID=2954497 RepID=UPI0020979A90|nr:O-antigen polymerase [Pseudoalteromonas sp. OANN1]MCO7198251.1 oligosaccharide repeat unit polymerase [Pseudoalteromonas sp. OANN1]